MAKCVVQAQQHQPHRLGLPKLLEAVGPAAEQRLGSHVGRLRPR